MSPTELEARRWRAAVDAVLGKNDIKVELERLDEATGRLLIVLKERVCDDAGWALWRSLSKPGQATARIPLLCSAAEWVEMLAQGSK